MLQFMLMEQFLIDSVVIHPYIVYGLIIILACAEGPILSMIGGALIRLGYFFFWPLYIALMLGDLIGDIVWYFLGRHFGHRFIARFGDRFGITEEKVAKVEKTFHKHKYSILFLNKLTTGFGFAIVTLFTAGMVKIPLRGYILTNISGQFIWTGLLITVGYFFGHTYEIIDNVMGKIFMIAIFILFILALYQYGKYLRTKAEEINV